MIKIVTDSGVSLPQALIQQHDIRVAAGTLLFDDEQVRDTTLSAEEFYDRLKRAQKLPRGRDSDMRDFLKLYREVQTQHPGAAILSIHVSESLAVTISAARMAAAAVPEVKVMIVDSQSVAIGQGLLVAEAADMAARDLPAPDIVKRLLALRERIQTYVVVDTLDYLAKGGRVGTATRFVGNLLDVKPVLTVRDGMVQPHSQHRSRERAINSVLDLLMADAEGKPGLVVGIMHAVCPEDAERLAGQVRARLAPQRVIITDIPPSVGTNTGPGSLGLAWYYDDPAGA